jgi:hypothetical protein
MLSQLRANIDWLNNTDAKLTPEILHRKSLYTIEYKRSKQMLKTIEALALL